MESDAMKYAASSTVLLICLSAPALAEDNMPPLEDLETSSNAAEGSEGTSEPDEAPQDTSTSTLSQGEVKDPPDPDDDLAPSKRSVSLTVRGGVSLGSYQAGLSWVLLKQWKKSNDIDLDTVTGTSAGNINAFLMATEWCKKENASTLWDNLFWKTWGRLGLWNELYPESIITQGKERAALFDREKATDKLEDMLENEWKTAQFDTECQVDIGVTMTRLTPFEVRSTKGQIFPLSRTVAHVLFETDEKSKTDEKKSKAKFSAQTPKEGDPCEVDAGLYYGLGGTKPKDIFELTKASSAFPVAFTPIGFSSHASSTLRVCQDGKWADAYALQKQEEVFFYDGGAFDNSPLALLSYLVDARSDRRSKGKAKARETYYINTGVARVLEGGQSLIDANLKESAKEMREGDDKDEPVVGLLGLIELATNYVASSYDLQLSSYYLRGTDRFEGMIVPTRLFSLYGDYLAHFGAFFATSFREYDYLVGVYDGVIQIQKEGGEEPVTRAQFEERLDELAIPSCSGERHVLLNLFSLEHEDTPTCDSPDALFDTQQGLLHAAKLMCERTLVLRAGTSKTSLDFIDDIIKGLSPEISQMTHSNYSTRFTDQYGKKAEAKFKEEVRIFKNTDEVLRHMYQDVLDRLVNIEIASKGLPLTPVRPLLHTFNSRTPHADRASDTPSLFYWSSSVPRYGDFRNKLYRWGALFVPDLWVYTAYQGGDVASQHLRFEFLNIGWSKYTTGSRRFWMSPSLYADVTRPVWSPSLNAGAMLELGVSLFPKGELPMQEKYHVASVLDLSLVLAADVLETEGARFNPGLRVYILDKFFLGGGAYLNLSSEDEEHTLPQWHVGLGVHDLMGLIYFINKLK